MKKNNIVVIAVIELIFAFETQARTVQRKYDEQDRLIEEDQGMRKYTYTYDEHGNKTEVQNMRGREIVSHFDKEGNIISDTKRWEYKDIDNDGNLDEAIAYEIVPGETPPREEVVNKYVYTYDANNPDVREVNVFWHGLSNQWNFKTEDVYIDGTWVTKKEVSSSRTTEYDKHGNKTFEDGTLAGNVVYTVYYNEYDNYGHLVSIKKKKCFNGETEEECKSYLNDTSYWSDISGDTYSNTYYVKDFDGSMSIYKDNNVIGYKNKRIYTIDEASRLSKPTGNIFKLRYK
ncbi:MAG: hypothetical protein IJ870_06115 [Alphaproteobacteria bacterium]|nr:hypothetical protein [Alphaproteobacteria bacterium]